MRTGTRLVRWSVLLLSIVALAGCHRLAIPAGTPSTKVALRTYHSRYVIALGESEGWPLRQSVELGQGDCGWFRRYDLGTDGFGQARIALETCYGRFVTAPRRGTTRLDREVWQESGLGDCGQFTLEPHGDGVALKTCAGRYLTAGDAGVGWEPPLQWAVIMEADKALEWEIVQILPGQ